MCLNPKRAYLNSFIDSETGEIVSKVYFTNTSDNLIGDIKEIYVKCNRCLECQRQYSNEWALRCCLESTLYQDNMFLTLTFKHTNGILEKRPLQLFLKRLRKYISPLKIRYFACGEYGSKGKRPHYHIIIFGYKFPDLYLFNKKEKLYRSPILEKLWPFGFSSVGVDINFETCKYVAKYMQKSNINGAFTCMSTKPGIGYDLINKSMADNDGLYFNGKKYFLPRYFEKVLMKKGVPINKNIRHNVMSCSNSNAPNNINLRISKYIANGLTKIIN